MDKAEETAAGHIVLVSSLIGWQLWKAVLQAVLFLNTESGIFFFLDPWLIVLWCIFKSHQGVPRNQTEPYFNLSSVSAFYMDAGEISPDNKGKLSFHSKM